MSGRNLGSTVLDRSRLQSSSMQYCMGRSNIWPIKRNTRVIGKTKSTRWNYNRNAHQDFTQYPLELRKQLVRFFTHLRTANFIRRSFMPRSPSHSFRESYTAGRRWRSADDLISLDNKNMHLERPAISRFRPWSERFMAQWSKLHNSFRKIIWVKIDGKASEFWVSRPIVRRR